MKFSKYWYQVLPWLEQDTVEVVVLQKAFYAFMSFNQVQNLAKNKETN